MRPYLGIQSLEMQIVEVTGVGALSNMTGIPNMRGEETEMQTDDGHVTAETETAVRQPQARMGGGHRKPAVRRTAEVPSEPPGSSQPC